jgi:hypothetical protein
LGYYNHERIQRQRREFNERHGLEGYRRDEHRGSQRWDATTTNGFNDNDANSTNDTDSTAQLTSIHELHPYRLPLPSPEGCGPAHFAQRREIGERSEGGTSGLRWYVANLVRPFLPADHPCPSQTLPPDAGSTTRFPHQ